MKTIKILFADDDLKYSMLLKRFLEAEGYEVTYAGNGNIAFRTNTNPRQMDLQPEMRDMLMRNGLQAHVAPVSYTHLDVYKRQIYYI